MSLRLDIADSSEWVTLKNAIGHRSYGQYRRQGIVWFSFWHQPETDLRCVFLQIDPAVMLGRRPFSITPLSELRRELPKALHQWLRQRSFVDWPSVLDWQLQRIDFAADIRCDSQASAETYASMACQGRLPRFLTTKYQRTRSNLHTKNKREGFQIYAKQLQIQDRHREASPDILSSYTGVLRCEVQLNRAKIKSIAQENGFGGYTLRHFLAEELAASLITRRLEEIAGPAGEHRTLASAKQRIAAFQTNKQISTAQAAKLRSFLDFIGRHPSVESARNACQNGKGLMKSVATFDGRVKALAAVGIALPCIPAGSPSSRLPLLLVVCRQMIDSSRSRRPFKIDITAVKGVINCVPGLFTADGFPVAKPRPMADCRQPFVKSGATGIPPPNKREGKKLRR